MSEPATPTPPAGALSRATTFLRRRPALLVAILLVALVGFMEWPELKGIYYRTVAPTPADGIPWQTTLSAALAQSQRDHKPVLVDFSASWCPPCQIMKHETWPDARVQSYVKDHFVPVKMDLDDAANAQTANHYGIYAIPAVLVLDASGKVLRSANYLNAQDMLAFLRQG